MNYCKLCLYPDTKPDLTFDAEGVCSACRAYEARKSINWEDRKASWEHLVTTTNLKGESDYDCIIPVSGGKDSFYQTLKALDYGLKPLLVNARTCDLSDIGRSNLDALSEVGADLLEVVPNQSLRRRINRYTLETIADISWPEHVLIFTVPVTVAIEKKIPLILWGENPQNEYGGPKEWQDKSDLVPNRWLQEFGGLNGLRLSDVCEALDLCYGDMSHYRYPTDTSGVMQKFLGYYFPWDGIENAKLAAQHGFDTPIQPVQTHGFDYENLDNYQTGIHDYFKYLKYGFGRASDICSNRIRRGVMTRREAVEHCKIWDGRSPVTYLGQSLDETLEKIEMPMADFKLTCNRFANKELFECSQRSWPRPKFEVE